MNADLVLLYLVRSFLGPKTQHFSPHCGDLEPDQFLHPTECVSNTGANVWDLELGTDWTGILRHKA